MGALCGAMPTLVDAYMVLHRRTEAGLRNQPLQGEHGLEVPEDEKVIWRVPADADAKWPLSVANQSREWMFEL